MGTNFYLITHDKEACLAVSPYKYCLTDVPYFAYEIHIAKTSCGWLPLFESHPGINSITDLERIYQTDKFVIVDEYGDTYNWEQFNKRVLQFNGGVQGVAELEYIDMSEYMSSSFFDKNMPNHTPVSHFEYGNGMYSKEYFKDPHGYEFTNHEFS